MTLRFLAPLPIAIGLAGCSSPSLPQVDLYGMSLPRFEIFRYGVKEDDAPTLPYPLAASEIADIKASFSSEFQDGRTLEFGPITARRRSAGNLVICGLVSISTPTGTKSGMTLFDGEAVQTTAPGRIAFTPKRIAGANAETIDVYGDCRDAGVL